VDLDWVNNPWLVAVNLLAAFRLTRLVIADAFPFGPLRLRITDWATERWTPGIKMTSGSIVDNPLTEADQRAWTAYDGTAPLAYLVTCPWCVGPYVSVIVALLASTGGWWTYPAAVLASSAVIGLLATLTD
jgi:hypothetical protein